MSTIGEDRVRIDFNPSGSHKVDDIKAKSAALIDACNQMKLGHPNEEARRCAAMAELRYEEAATWAVKAATWG